MAWYRVFALSPPSLSPVRKREMRDSPETRKSEAKRMIIRAPEAILNLVVVLTPSSSFFPKNWAPKIPAPLTVPNMQRLNTKISWLAMLTPLISSVPMRPTITLSRRLTKLVIPFCMAMGNAMDRTMR